jgi:hypothetical protein
MHDYFSAAAGLRASMTHASSVLSVGDTLATQLFPLASEPSYALLGALFESLVAQKSGAAEMKRLDKALNLWRTLTTLIGDLRAARDDLDAGAALPSDADKGAAAIASAAGLRDTILPNIQDWTRESLDFLHDPNLINYLPSSGQATDADPKTWNWHELVTARRTGALRWELLKASSGTAGTAMALGAVSGYSTRLVVGSWRNAIVGGPPRNHPLRSRLVARTGGAWLRAHMPTVTPSLGDLLTQLQAGVGVALPDSVVRQLDQAMKAAYGQFLPAKSAPEFKRAYGAMLRHLSILDQLRFWVEAPAGQPAVPVIPPPVALPASVLTKATATLNLLGSNAAGAGQGGTVKSPAGIGGGGQAGTNINAKAYSGKSGAEWWKIVLAVLVTIILTAVGIIVGILGGPAGMGAGGAIGLSLGVAFGNAIGAWGDNSFDTVAQTQQALSTPDAAVICKELFDLDITLYAAASNFLTVLKGAGLAYPETPDLGTPPFSELLAVKYLDIHRAMPTLDSFAAYPTSPLEQVTPSGSPGWHYGAGVLPDSAIGPTGLQPFDSASLSLSLWRSCLFGEATLANQNHNLEADRGFMMLCWSGLTKPQPVSVKLLAYQAI